jgi:1-phosphofructokinase family hexose kinase
MILVLGQNAAWQLTYRTGELARGEVNRMSEAFGSGAGKGANAARALTLLGLESRLLTYAGGVSGDRYLADCENDGIPVTCVRIAEETRTCTTVIEDDGAVTEIIEPPPVITSTESAAFFEQVTGLVSTATLLVISGTAVTGEPSSRYREFIEAAHAVGTPVLLDSYRDHGKNALPASPEYLKINAVELADLTERLTETSEQRRDASRDLIESYGLRWVIITLGGSGAEGFSANSSVRVQLPNIKIANSIGAGDSFTAGVAASISSTNTTELSDACRMGAAAGTANCLDIKPGRFDLQTYARYLGEIEVVAL